MKRLPNPLDVRGENSFRSRTCPGKLKVGKPREILSEEKTMNPTGNPKKYLECDVTRAGWNVTPHFKVANTARSVHKTIEIISWYWKNASLIEALGSLMLWIKFLLICCASVRPSWVEGGGVVLQSNWMTSLGKSDTKQMECRDHHYTSQLVG